MQLLGPFEEAYRKSTREPQRMQARPQGGFPIPGPGQGRSGIPGTFPPVGSLPAFTGYNDSGIMAQPMGGNNLQGPDIPSSGMNVPFPNGQTQLPQRPGPQQMPNGLGNNMDAASFNMSRPGTNGVPMAPSIQELNAPGSLDLDADGRKRKMEDGDEANGKRARQKTGRVSSAVSNRLFSHTLPF